MEKFLKIWTWIGLLMIHPLTTEAAESWLKTYEIETFIGPEIYGVSRLREGGTQQNGVLYGFRLGYDYLKRCKYYCGADFLWAQGILNGYNTQAHLKSILTDSNLEARIGYTFQSKNWRCASFTPYIGGGYFWEKNIYKHPSPLHVHFKNEFLYIPIGFISQIFIIPSFSVGLNVKWRFLLQGEQQVSHDPEYDRSIQHYNEKLQYRVELPLTYFFCSHHSSLGVRLVPFYEYRHYGRRANFPFDFFDTQFKCYGAVCKLLYLF